MQWLVLTGGLPVGAWRERLGLPNHCPLCPLQPRETLQHALQECPEKPGLGDVPKPLKQCSTPTEVPLLD